MPLEDLLKKSDTTDYDESVVKFMPTYPGLSLTSHVVLKNVQVLIEAYFFCPVPVGVMVAAADSSRQQTAADSSSVPGFCAERLIALRRGLPVLCLALAY